MTNAVESVFNQLENRVRYLDLRLSNNKYSYNIIDDTYITHEYLYEKFIYIVNQVNNFIINNANEIVFMNINYWY